MATGSVLTGSRRGWDSDQWCVLKTKNLRDVGFLTIRALAVLPGANDPAQLAYTAAHDLVLVTRNFQDFVRLNEFWTVLREWGHSQRPHAGILIPLGSVLDRNWADRVMDLLLHPNCPPLADQLLIWRAKTGDWVTDGMTFYLQDASSGNSAGSSRTLAAVRVRVGR